MAQYSYEDEIELGDLVLMVWRGRWVIGLAVLGAVLAATLYCTYLREPAYEARISFLAPDYKLADGSVLRQGDYLPLFRKESIAEELVHRHNLATSSTEAAIAGLMSDIKPQPQSGTMVVEVSLRHADRAVALDILRDYESLVRSEVTSFATSLNNDYVQRLEASLEARKSAYETALEDLKEFQKAYDVDGMRSTLSDRQQRLLSAESRVDELESRIETLTASLEKALSQLAETEPVIVTKDVLDEPSLGLLDQLMGGSLTGTSAVERESPNPTYTQLAEVVHTSQRQLESSRAELEVAIDQVSVLKEEVTALRQTLADAEEVDAELRLATKHTQSSYENATVLYDSAMNTVLNTSYAISTASGPWAATSPVGPGRLMIAALAAVLAGFVSVMLLFFMEYMKADERQTTGRSEVHPSAPATAAHDSVPESVHVAK